LLEAAERRFDLGISGKLAALGLSEALQDGGQVSSDDLFRLALVSAQREHGERDFILTVRRETPHRFKSFSRSFVIFVQ
jgi:hypothetical protein